MKTLGRTTGRESGVQCPYWTGQVRSTCSAARHPYEPSSFQREEYCSGEWYVLCPLSQVGLPYFLDRQADERPTQVAGLS